MAIQVRRGNESDFDASKMLPGEWAVSLDTKYVRMCFAPGVVLRMSTYEAFEADVSQIKAIFEECRTIEAAIRRIQTEVNSKASLTVEYANSAKESAERAYTEAERAKTYANNAEAVTGVQIATQERAGLIKGGDNYIAEDGTLVLIEGTTSTTLPNSHAGRFKFDKIGGVMEQEQTEGNQLWSYGDVSSGSVSNIPWSISAGEYTFSTATTSFELTIRVYYEDNSEEVFAFAQSPTTFTLQKNVVKFNYNTYGAIADIMVNKGTTALPYEKFSGGIPAPNPSYKIEVENSVVSGVRTHGNQLFDVGNAQIGVAWNGDANAARAIVVVPCKPSTTYTIACDISIFDSVHYFEKALEADKTTLASGTVSNTKVIATNASTNFIVIQFNKTNITLADIKNAKVMFNNGNTALPYEPYTESSITFSQPIELYGNDSVQDVVTPKEINREYGEIVLNSSSGWARQASGYFYCPLHDAKKVYTSAEPYFALCDSYKFVAKDGMKLSNGECTMYKDANYSYPNQNWFYVCDTSCTTTEELNAKLDASPIKLVYPLRTPNTEALPIADQIALNSLATYDGITYVEFIYEGLEPTFKGEYGTSKVGGYTLESLLTARNNDLRITAVESAVVNNL